MDAADRFVRQEELHRDPRFVRWRAFDKLLECEVLLEQPGDAVAARLTAASGSRMLREARALARVQHPGIVRLREVTWRDGLPLLVLESRAGEPLSDVLARRGKLTAHEVLRLGRELADAAQAVHSVGVVHRGISPENVLIDPRDGSAILGGFGFAKPLDRTGALSSLDHQRRQGENAAAAGLPDYAAPEQIAGQSADARADVFALGSLLFRCLTGEEAFAPDQVDPVEAASVRKLAPEAPQPLAEAIERCLRRSPTARLPSMLAVAEALAGGEVAAPHRSWSRWLIAGSAIVLGALTLFAVREFAASPDPVKRGQEPLTDPPLHVYAPRYEVSRAVLVGINYLGHPHFPQLRNAERDVLAVEAALHDLGWSRERVQTLTGTDASEQRVADALTETLNIAGPDDQVFVYLAGHGEIRDNDPQSGFFVAADGGPDETKLRWLHFSVLQELVEHTRAKHVFVALDCCHAGAAPPRSGTSPRPSRPSERSRSRVEQELLRRPAKVWLTSALAEERATDGTGDHSPFAAGLLAALRSAKDGGSVTSGLVHALVWKELANQRAEQRCGFKTDPAGAEFVFLSP